MRYSALVTRVHVSSFLVFVAEPLTELVHYILQHFICL